MKIDFNIVAIEVDKLYAKEFEESAIDQLNEHCSYIETFIQSCGWEVEEFNRRWNTLSATAN